MPQLTDAGQPVRSQCRQIDPCRDTFMRVSPLRLHLQTRYDGNMLTRIWWYLYLLGILFTKLVGRYVLTYLGICLTGNSGRS